MLFEIETFFLKKFVLGVNRKSSGFSRGASMYRGVTRYGTNQKGNFNNGVALVFNAWCPSCSPFQLSLATHLNIIIIIK